MENNLDTISAITPGDDTTLSRFNTAEQDKEYSDTLVTEHDVFDDFKSKGDDPNIDILDSIHIEGSFALRVRIRTLLEKFRSVFATSLPSEPALITPVDKERWEQPSNQGPPRVQSPANMYASCRTSTNESDRAFYSILLFAGHIG
jgi:hypothetical protein